MAELFERAAALTMAELFEKAAASALEKGIHYGTFWVYEEEGQAEYRGGPACAWGHLRLAAGSQQAYRDCEPEAWRLAQRAVEILEVALGRPVPYWNDYEKPTAQQVAAVMLEVARQCRAGCRAGLLGREE